MMDQNVTPSKTLHKQFPAPLIPQSYGRPRTETVPSSMSNLWTPFRHRNLHGKQLKNLTRLRGTSPKLWVFRPFLEKPEAPLPHQKRVCNFIHPKQHSPCPERQKLPYPDEEISSGCEKDVSFIRDGFTTWVKADFNTILERHAVDVRRALAEFREASARRHDTSAQEYHFDSNVPNRSSVQKRLSICNWNPGPRRGTGRY